jgi:predicted TPR repeat methyltransferase
VSPALSFHPVSSIRNNMDHCKISSEMFDKHARLYQEKFACLTLYDVTYRKFCELLTKQGACVLDAACGPGHVSRYLLSQRPDLEVLGIDLAPQMIALAREGAPLATFAKHDCRDLCGLRRAFDGIICAFGLPYLSREEVAGFIASSSAVINSGGVLYISVMEGNYEDSGLERTSTGDRVYVYYHSESYITALLTEHGFSVVDLRRMASPSPAPKQTNDLFILALKTEQPKSTAL